MTVRAVIAPFIPSGIVAVLSGVGIAALCIDESTTATLGDLSMTLPPVGGWPENTPTSVQIGDMNVPLQWLARAHERTWAGTGAARMVPPPRPSRPR